MIQVVIIGLGGFVGAAGRYLVSGVVYRLFGSNFPYGTLAVNLLGCFFIGLFMTMLSDRVLINPNLRSFLTIGILGGFTTFSTFSYETLMLIRDGSLLAAVANVAFSVLFGLIAVYWGIVVARIL